MAYFFSKAMSLQATHSGTSCWIMMKRVISVFILTCVFTCGFAYWRPVRTGTVITAFSTETRRIP
jgi:hypothetical protein